jgi:cation diffusion facilitator CzcD-associated flavoprotein CzcO
MSDTEHVETVIIGGGQAGLATGYHLARRQQPFVILDARDRVSDVWRERFDSLRLYSPAGYAGHPRRTRRAGPRRSPTRVGAASPVPTTPEEATR